MDITGANNTSISDIIQELASFDAGPALGTSQIDVPTERKCLCYDKTNYSFDLDKIGDVVTMPMEVNAETTCGKRPWKDDYTEWKYLELI